MRHTMKARYADADRWSPAYVLARQCVQMMRRTKHGPRAVDIVAEHIQLAIDEAREHYAPTPAAVPARDQDEGAGA